MVRYIAVMMLAAVFGAGCAMIGVGTAPPDASVQLDRALAALAEGEYLEGRIRLDRLRARHPSEPAGQRALLVLAALELDPRNPRRQPTRAARYAAAHLDRAADDRAAWLDPIAEAFYTVALDLGASPPLAGGPTRLPGLPLARRLAAAELARDSLRVRADSLERALAGTREVVAEQNAEIERLRRLLEP